MANQTIQLSDGTNSLFPTIKVLSVTGTGTCESGSWGSGNTALTLTSGTWLLLCRANLSTSSDTTYSLQLLVGNDAYAMVRGNMTNGGGSATFAVAALTRSTAINARIYQLSGSSSTMTYNLYAIKLA